MFVCQVVVYVLHCHLSCFVVCLVDDVDGARNKQHGLLAMLGHSCTLLGFSGGLQIGQTLRPTHKSVIQEDCVVKVLRCMLTIPHLHPRSPACACIRTHHAPPGQPRRHHEPRRPATRHSRAYEAAPVRSRDCPCLTDIGLPASGCPTPHGSGAPPEFRGQAAGSSVSL